MLTCLQIDAAIEIVVTATVVLYYSISRMNNRIMIFVWIYQEISHTLRLVISDIPFCRSTGCINSDGYRVDTRLIETTLFESPIIITSNQIAIYRHGSGCWFCFADFQKRFSIISSRTIAGSIRSIYLCFYFKRSRDVKRKSSVTFTIGKTEIFLVVIDIFTIFVKEVTNQIIVADSNTFLLCNNSHLSILCYSERIDKTSLQCQGCCSFCCEGNIRSSTNCRNSLSSSQTILCAINSKSNCSISSCACEIKRVSSIRTCQLRRTIE